MTPTSQRNVVVNFIKNEGDTSKPDTAKSDVIDRLIHERGLILDPMTSRDGVQKALALLNRGQQVAFQEELARWMPRITPPRVDHSAASAVHATALFDVLTASPALLCKVLIKVIGKWDPRL